MEGGGALALGGMQGGPVTSANPALRTDEADGLIAVPEDEACAIRATLSGERAAFGLFFERYAQRAYRSAAFLLGSRRADAEDVVQEAFLDALRGLRTYRPTQPFYPWLYAILRRRAMQHLSRRQPPPPEPPTPDAPPGMVGAELSWALAHLTVERREVLLLHHVLGYGVDEIARMCRVPPGTVKSRLHRARVTLGGLLGEANGDAGGHRP